MKFGKDNLYKYQSCLLKKCKHDIMYYVEHVLGVKNLDKHSKDLLIEISMKNKNNSARRNIRLEEQR